jgi:heptosyltransferase-3
MTEKKRFLILRFRCIGDVILATTLCETLKKNFPSCQVDIVVYPFTAEVLKNNPYIDNVIVIAPEWKDVIKKTLPSLRFARQQHYDYCIDLKNDTKSYLFAKLSGAKKLITHETKRSKKRSYDILVKEDPDFLIESKAPRAVRSHLHLITALKKEFAYTTDYKIYLSKNEIEETRAFLIKQGIDFSRPLFFCAPISGDAYKQWPLNYFTEVFKHCIEKYDAQLIACPAPNEFETTLSLKETLIKPESYQVFSGLTLRDVPRLAKLSQLYIGNDGGSCHMAISVGTPSLAIFSPCVPPWDWSMLNNPRHVAVTLQDALSLTREDYEQLLKTKSEKELIDLFPKITPQLVIKKLDALYGEIK